MQLPHPNANVQAVIDLLLSRGWHADGRTRSEVVRVPTVRAPVFGGIGGELRTYGGRLRFVKREMRCTVGPRTTCTYFQFKTGICSEFASCKTKDMEAVTALIEAVELKGRRRDWASGRTGDTVCGRPKL